MYNDPTIESLKKNKNLCLLADFVRPVTMHVDKSFQIPQLIDNPYRYH